MSKILVVMMGDSLSEKLLIAQEILIYEPVLKNPDTFLISELEN